MDRVFIALLVIFLCSCRPSEPEPEQRKPQQAGQPLDPVKTAARMAAIRGSAIVGDQEGVARNLEAFGDDFRKSIACRKRPSGVSYDGVGSEPDPDSSPPFIPPVRRTPRST